MGSHKHGIHGHPTKSPRLRLWERLQAERQERKPRKIVLVYASVIEAVRRGR